MQHDAALVTFINLAEKESASIDLTLLVRGALVIGTPISARQWGQALLESLADAINRSNPGVGDSLRKVPEESTERTTPSSGEEEKTGPQYVHLRNVVVLAGHATSHLPLWRGRVDQVDGWTLGSISSS